MKSLFATISGALLALALGAGPAAEIDRLQHSFRVDAREAADKGGFERLFEHQPLAFLMGPEGDILTLFPPIPPPPEIARIIHGYL